MVKLLPIFKRLKNNKRYTLVSGGRGSAKSFHVSAFLLLLTYQKNEVILFTRYTMASAHISIIPEFRDKIEKMEATDAFHITEDEITNKYTGSKIIFRGIKTSSGNQTANLKSIHGITCWVLDEAEELPNEEIFDKIDNSIRSIDAQNRVILILNPTIKKHWIYKKWFKVPQDDTEYIHTTYLDNLNNLSNSFIDKANKVKESDTDKYDNVYLGKWANIMKGLTFRWQLGWNDEVGQTAFGLDFGYHPDPLALIQVKLQGKKMFLRQHIYKTHMSTSAIVEAVKSIVPRGCYVLCDKRKDIQADLIKNGVNAHDAKKGPGSIDDGVKTMLDFEIYIHPESLDLIAEFELFKNKEDANGDPIPNVYSEKNNHGIDATRYGLAHLTNKPQANVGVTHHVQKMLK